MAEKKTKPTGAASKKSDTKKSSAKPADIKKTSEVRKPSDTKKTAETKKPVEKKVAESNVAEVKGTKITATNNDVTSGTPTTGTTKKRPKKGLIIGLILALVIIIVGALVTLFCFKAQDPKDETSKLSYSNSFFIYDNGKNTLWNKEGKRLTNDDYSYYSNFINGYAMVRKDDQYGIIREDGKMSVDFGKYGDISFESGLFLAQNGNTKEYSLLTGSGKEVLKGSDIQTFLNDSSNIALAVQVNDEIMVYNYDGKLITKTSAVENAKDPQVHSSEDYGLFSYNNSNVLFDARDGNILAEFEGSNYLFDIVSEDRSIVMLEEHEESNDSKGSMSLDGPEGTGKYKLFTGGKLYDLNETKFYGVTQLNHVIGYDDGDDLALLDEDYKVTKRVNSYLELKDSNNYAVENEDGKVEIYRNGEKVKEFGEGSSVSSGGVLFDDFYAIDSDGKSMFYNLDGSVAIDHEYKEIYDMFNEFHHAIVSDDDDEYYLINTSGGKISDQTFARIVFYEGGYELQNKDGKYAVANKDGKVLTEFKYDDVYYRSAPLTRNIWTGETSDDKCDVIDADSGKVILADVEVDGFFGHYFTVENADGKNEYYTYDGVLFYTEEDKDAE